jgi:tetratricopeptide (TPR) repeat protein
VEFATNRKLAGYYPGRLQVRDSGLAEHLAGELSDLGIRVNCCKRLDALDGFMEFMACSMHGKDLPPGALKGRGATVERMRRFAEAAKGFFEAAPWRELTGEDLIQVETPACPADMRFAVVLGASGQEFGLGFYRSEKRFWEAYEAEGPEDYLALRRGGLWSLTYDSITELPLQDADLWEDHKLPVSGANAYPCAMCFLPDRTKRPDAKRLSYLEGLLRALSASRSEDFDSGSWTREVETADGLAVYTLSLPLLIDPPGFEELYDHGVPMDSRALESGTADVHRFFEGREVEDVDALNRQIAREFAGHSMDETHYEPRNGQEKAQQLCYKAFDAFGRQKKLLARKALQTWPDCADAYVILAELASEPQSELELYSRGVEAERRALGEEVFEEELGMFWDDLRARPYMRALFGLAQTQQDLDQYEEAARNYRELLRLNPEDNQGVRYLLLPLLVEMGEDTEAMELLQEYKDDQDVIFLYMRALLAFRAEGDSQSSRSLLRRARKANPHVPERLLDEEESAPLPNHYGPGTEEEAAICALECSLAWESSPGALDWLARQTKSS